MNPLKFYIFSFFTFLLCTILGYISGVGAITQLFFGLIFYTLIAYCISYIWKILKGKQKTPLRDFSEYFIPKILGGLAFLILILLSFSVYQNFISPALMPLYTLSNGEKTLKFQAMSHVASAEFYTQVQANIRNSKQEDYVLFFEGVGPGSEDSIKTFNTALGIDFGPDLYKNFSKLYGIVSQNNDDFLNIINDKDFNIDLNLDEVVAIYQEKQKNTSSENTEKNSIPDEVLDINSEIITMLAELNPRELGVLRFLNQAIMNFMIKNEGLRNTIINELGNADIFGVILDDRNEFLVEEIIKSEEQKIHILYGLMHFKGVLELLKSEDPNWRVTETEYSQVIEQS